MEGALGCRSLALLRVLGSSPGDDQRTLGVARAAVPTPSRFTVRSALMIRAAGRSQRFDTTRCCWLWRTSTCCRGALHHRQQHRLHHPGQQLAQGRQGTSLGRLACRGCPSSAACTPGLGLCSCAARVSQLGETRLLREVGHGMLTDAHSRAMAALSISSAYTAFRLSMPCTLHRKALSVVVHIYMLHRCLTPAPSPACCWAARQHRWPSCISSQQGVQAGPHCQ